MDNYDVKYFGTQQEDGISQLCGQPKHFTEVAKGRVTVVEQIVHQQQGSSPTCVESRYSLTLKSDEQPYIRKSKAEQRWQLLDTGWLKDASEVSIHNDEGRFTLVNPTPEQQELAKLMILELSFDGATASISISPGTSCRFSPVNVNSVWVRCLTGPCKMSTTVYPK